jgi:hypothetical protein
VTRLINGDGKGLHAPGEARLQQPGTEGPPP